MAIQCFKGFLGSIFHKICRSDEELAETFPCLPDCLIIDILSRLPIDTLVRCRGDLRALISSQYFTTLHLSRSRHMLLIQDLSDFSKRNRSLYVLSEKSGEFIYVCRQPQVTPGEVPPIIFHSCQGVVLLVTESTYHVLNPITQEEVIVHRTDEAGQLCALYFCRGFKLLYAQIRGSLCQYLVYIFKTRTWRKIRTSSTNFNLLPSKSPAIINGALHWIILTDLEKKGLPPNCANNGIIVFRMDKEELSAMPHPGSVCNTKQEHKMMILGVKENSLSFCHFLVPECTINIWILEDYDMWAWNKSYKINLFHEMIFCFRLHWPYSLEELIQMSWRIFHCYIQDGELLLYFWGDYYFIYNLDHKTVKEVKLPQEYWVFCSYIKSLLPIA